MSSRRHYLDHASTSPLRPEAAKAINSWLDSEASAVMGDPGRVHSEGRNTRVIVEEAREKVAAFLGVTPRQVIFTSGGTESVNSASWGATRARPGGPVLLAEVEHSSVRESSSRLADCVGLAVDSTGRIEPGSLEDAIERCRRRGRDPALVHCQLANHEVGTLQPLGQIVEIAKREDIPVHVDACTGAGKLEIDIGSIGADMVSVSAHKLGGPPGVGALIVRRRLRLEPFVVGGEQERARRAGFENLPGIVGFGAVAESLAAPGAIAREEEVARTLTTQIVQAALKVDGVEVLGDTERRVPHIVCFAISGVEAEAVLLSLDQAGIAAHSGSSCSSESLAPSPVLEAIGADAQRSLRLSVGWSSTGSDVEAFTATFGSALARLRALGS